MADTHHPEAELIRVALDNLSTHAAGALYETFPAPEARCILQRLELRCTPKHASWLNMAEIEIGVLRGQCLDRRISEHDVLVAEIAAWQRQRNASGARIKGKFTTQEAQTKLARAYLDIANRSTARGAHHHGEEMRRLRCRLEDGGPFLLSVVVWRPSDTGCSNSVQQIGPRCSQAPSFVAAGFGEHE